MMDGWMDGQKGRWTDKLISYQNRKEKSPLVTDSQISVNVFSLFHWSESTSRRKRQTSQAFRNLIRVGLTSAERKKEGL